MRLLASLVFLVGAVWIGTHAYFPLDTARYGQLAEALLAPFASVINARDDAAPKADAAEGMQGRNFSPGSRLLRFSGNAVAPDLPQVANPAPATMAQSATPATSSAEPASELATSSLVAADELRSGSHPQNAWRTVIVTKYSQAHRAAPKPDDYNARYQLARSLQAELARVGCYRGNIDGDWGSVSKRAAGAFLRKVNATLPIEKPDYILLTLIQGHSDKACGVDCPHGQGLASDGRCVPNVIIARGPNSGKLLARQTLGDKHVKSTDQVAPIVAAAAPAPVPTHSTNPRQQSRPDTGNAAAAASPELAGSVPADASRFEQAGLPRPANAAPRPAELPGIMAIGAPTPERDSLQTAPVAAATPTPPPVPTQANADPHRHDQHSGRPHVARANESSPRTSSHSRERPSASPSVEQRPQRETYAPKPRKSKEQRYTREGRHDMVRTFSGKVRRGSPQHNLMLSLGGVF